MFKVFGGVIHAVLHVLIQRFWLRTRAPIVDDRKQIIDVNFVIVIEGRDIGPTILHAE